MSDNGIAAGVRDGMPRAQVPGLRIALAEAPIARHVPRMVEIANAGFRADGIDELTTEADLTNWVSHPSEHFDPERDVALARVGDELVGYTYVDWVDTNDGLREYRLRGHVHPEWQRRGIGGALLAWGERHAAEHAAAYPGDRPVVVGTWTAERRIGKVRLLEEAGYEAVRWFFEMRRPTLDGVEEPPLPGGIEVRPIGDRREEWRRLFEADAEAFRDHWGGFAADEAAFEEWLGEPGFDPSLFVVAWDGDEIAGAVINAVPREENELYGRRRGWLESVFVRRAWRRRGLGAALVARALIRLRDAGLSEAMLGVDSDNPTGALGLYERAGFEIDTRSRAYRKPLPEVR